MGPWDGVTNSISCVLNNLQEEIYTATTPQSSNRWAGKREAVGFEFDDSRPALSLNEEINVSRGFRGV